MKLLPLFLQEINLILEVTVRDIIQLRETLKQTSNNQENTNQNTDQNQDQNINNNLDFIN